MLNEKYTKMSFTYSFSWTPRRLCDHPSLSFKSGPTFFRTVGWVIAMYSWWRLTQQILSMLPSNTSWCRVGPTSLQHWYAFLCETSYMCTQKILYLFTVTYWKLQHSQCLITYHLSSVTVLSNLASNISGFMPSASSSTETTICSPTVLASDSFS